MFLPSFINFNSGNENQRSYACPYAQTMPYLARAAFGDIKLLKPIIDREQGDSYLLNQIYNALRPYRKSKASIKDALTKAGEAQKKFTQAVKRRGAEILENIPERTIVIVGRSYNAFDSGINLEIPKKLAALGVFSLPMDYLPLESVDIFSKWSNMYWRSGQNILRAGEIIRENPKLFALCIGNFSCGPDSFINRFFEKTMSNKPFLQIEIDEHSADAGVITRCEAFLDSISSRKEINVTAPVQSKNSYLKKGANNKIVYIPRMSDHAFGIAAAFESCGLDAQVMNVADAETVKLGRRFVSGKECYPCAITTGEMVKKVMSADFNPDRAVFFMPSGAGPCRFGQYNVFHRLVLDDMGLPHVPIYAPNQDEAFYSELGIVGKDFSRQAWRGIIAIELLVKCLHETRPYEVNKGETDNLYREYLSKAGSSVRSTNGAMPAFLDSMRKAFSEIPVRREEKPLIGIIGEIFVRQNAFANENIIQKVEALGGEVWLAPVEEWIYYVNLMGMRKSMKGLFHKGYSGNNVRDLLGTAATRYVQSRIEHKFGKPFEGMLKTLHEPSTKEILKNASPYLHDSFEGEAVLSMGKAVDFVKKGASGIISAMPFGCMPGTIVSALLKGLKQDTGIPCLSASYDGIEAMCSEIELEAFMHQSGEYMSAGKVK